MTTNAKVMHGNDCVGIQIDKPVPTMLVLTPDEADQLADKLREHARHARDVAAQHCETCNGPCRDESDWEEA